MTNACPGSVRTNVARNAVLSRKGVLRGDTDANIEAGLEPAWVCERILAAAACVKGANLVKFVIGRRRRHERYFRVEGVGLNSVPALRWGAGSSHCGRILHAEDKCVPGLQREQRLVEEEIGRCFQVVLDGKVLALMAPSRRDKQLWVAGLNAVAGGLLPTSDSKI